MNDQNLVLEMQNALNRTIRVSDQACTSYAVLRDKYERRGTMLDLSILLLSAWLSAMVWVQPEIAVQLTPALFNKDIWIGLLSITAFALSLVQLQVNWKSRATRYHQAILVLSTYVKELRPLSNEADVSIIKLALARYQAITEPLESIPEIYFLRLKQQHRIKILISKHLDRYPATNITVLRIKLFWRHTRHTLINEDNLN